MKANEIGEKTERKETMCPFLGLKDDPTTALSFSSSGNHCFHAKPVLPVKLEFQDTHCLTPNHIYCEEYNRPPDTPLLRRLRFEGSVSWDERIRKSRLWIYPLVIVIMALIGWLILSFKLSVFGKPASVLAGQTVSSSTATTSIQLQDTSTPTLMATSTESRLTPSSLPGTPMPHVLETPIGLKPELIIHRVLSGESLPSIASYYWTTIDAIQAVNYNLPIPLQVGYLVIVPINQTDVQSLPAFYPYEIEQEISAEDLAKQLSADPSLVKRYNGLMDNEVLTKGEWLVIPK